MPPEIEAAESKALSVDDAVALLDEQASPAGESEGGPEASVATPDADAATPNDTTANAAADAVVPEPSALQAPATWDEEARARFGQLPPDLQTLIASREAENTNAVAKAKADADEAKASAERNASAQMGEYKTLLDKLIPEATKTFRSRWADMDWTTLPERVGAEEAFKLKAQFEKERDQLQQLDNAHKIAEQRAYTDFVKAESGKLREVAPDLADMEKGPVRREALGKFLVGQGYTHEQIRFMTAHDAAIAYDAMRWREAEAKTRALAKAKPQQAKPALAAKPSALAPARATPAKKSEDAFRRLSKSGRVDDAVAYLNSRSK